MTNKFSEKLTKKIAKGGGIAAIGAAFSKLLQLAFHILLGRVLGPGGYGLYALGFIVIQMGGKFAILGLQNGLIRFIPIYSNEGNQAKIKGTLISAFAISILTSVLLGALLFIFSEEIALKVFNDHNLVWVIRIFSINLPFFVLMEMSAHSARAFHQIGYFITVRNLIWPVANIFFVGIAFLLGYRIYGAIVGFGVSVFISTVIGLLFVTQKVFPQWGSLSAKFEVKKLLRFSLPVVFIGFGQLLLNQTDRVMLGYFMSSADVGIYNAAMRIAIQTTFIISSINVVFAPMISNLYDKGNTNQLDKLFKLTTRWIFMLTLPWLLIIVLFPDQIMNLFGTGFVKGTSVLITLSLAHFVNAIAGSVGFILVMSGKQDIEFANIFGMATINIILNIWLIQIYGIIGAALGTGISIAFINILRLIEVFKLIEIQPYTLRYVKPMVSGGISLLVTFFILQSILHFHWLIGLMCCLLLYIGFILILGLESEDREIIRALLTKLTVL